MKNNSYDCLLIVDFGSQVTQLIARRLRELNVYCEIHPYQNVNQNLLKRLSPKAIILSGGPDSVTRDGSPRANNNVYNMGVPVLGICYGQQVMMHQLGGEVKSGTGTSEFGKAFVEKKNSSNLLEGWFDIEKEQVWMSHGDHVSKIAPGFEVFGTSPNAPYAIIGDEKRHFYAVQFHPEVHHTPKGRIMFENFISIANIKRTWTMDAYKEIAIKKIRKQVGSKKVICGLSGGVDSSVAAALIHEAIGDQLTCVFVDHGLLRRGEADEVISMFRDNYNIPLIHADESDLFLNELDGQSDPETKRKIIGRLFVNVFQKYANKIENAEFLAQGTLYPDVIESVSFKGGPSVTIKSHHNVGGLPDNMKMELVEPLRELFKDEVRKIGIELGLPKSLVYRHPFPGPGLGVRILGEVKKEYADLLRLADNIYIEELREHDLYDDVSQAFSVFLPVRSVGVMGDTRKYDYVIALRAVVTVDFMTAHWAHLPYEFLEKVSNRIINEVEGISRVTYDISGKPPATIEWE